MMDIATILGLGQTALELGLISSLTVLALFLSYSMLNVCDLSTDGCFTLGATVGAVVGATYPEMGKVLREIMPKAYILVPGYGAQGGKGKDLVHFFNKDGLGAIVNSSRGIIAAYQQDAYKEKYLPENYADASRAAVLAMKEDIASALA